MKRYLKVLYAETYSMLHRSYKNTYYTLHYISMLFCVSILSIYHTACNILNIKPAYTSDGVTIFITWVSLFYLIQIILYFLLRPTKVIIETIPVKGFKTTLYITDAVAVICLLCFFISTNRLK